ncbi:hypothetical protein SEA1_gp0055 [Salmonella phage SEA1]|nr:hypothetical protein SEA1_gp0055 [Salmonella phage SEA1]
MAIVKVKFKRLKVNACFTLSMVNGTMALKTSKNTYKILGPYGVTKSSEIAIDEKTLVWADTFQVKRWYQL